MAIQLDSVEVQNPISLSFHQGDDVTINFDLTDENDNTPDLTGATVRADIRKEYGKPVLASFTVDSTDLATGQFVLSLPAATTGDLPTRRGSRVTSFVFDVRITYASGDIDTLVNGYLKMTRQVTV